MSTKRPSHLPPFRNPAAPSAAAAPAEALAWLIIWSDVNAITGDVVERQSVCRHNAVADYRAVDPDARVFPLYAATHVPRADLSPIATRKLEELAGQGYVTNGVAIFNPATGKRGLVDNLGYVGWQGAQGIDLGQFNALAAHANAVVHHGDESPMKNGVFAEAERLLALIDGRDAGAGLGNIQPPRDLRTQVRPEIKDSTNG